MISELLAGERRNSVNRTRATLRHPFLRGSKIATLRYTLVDIPHKIIMLLRKTVPKMFLLFLFQVIVVDNAELVGQVGIFLYPP